MDILSADVLRHIASFLKNSYNLRWTCSKTLRSIRIYRMNLYSVQNLPLDSMHAYVTDMHIRRCKFLNLSVFKHLSKLTLDTSDHIVTGCNLTYLEINNSKVLGLERLESLHELHIKNIISGTFTLCSNIKIIYVEDCGNITLINKDKPLILESLYIRNTRYTTLPQITTASKVSISLISSTIDVEQLNRIEIDKLSITCDAIIGYLKKLKNRPGLSIIYRGSFSELIVEYFYKILAHIDSFNLRVGRYDL